MAQSKGQAVANVNDNNKKGTPAVTKVTETVVVDGRLVADSTSVDGVRQ